MARPLSTPLRAFTLAELAVVLAVIGLASSVALSSLTETLREARYRAARARLYLEVAHARDISRDRRRQTELTLTGDTVTLQNGPGGVACPGLGGPAVTFVLPALRSVAASEVVCFNNGRGPAGNAIAFTDGLAGPVDVVSSKVDGRVADSWGEFVVEGGLDAAGCDVDVDAVCGK